MSGSEGKGSGQSSLDRVLTIPNAISFMRILLIPVFVILLLDRRTEVTGLALLVAVVSTDWIDGLIARRTGQVSNLGKLLDPLADRLALGAALLALVVRDAFPPWAAALVLLRDGMLVVGAAILLVRTGVRIDVRPSGKIATFALMVGIPLVGWGNLGRPLGGAALLAGWSLFGFGFAAYLLTTVAYVRDARRALAGRTV